jgi:hypothetical protein
MLSDGMNRSAPQALENIGVSLCEVLAVIPTYNAASTISRTLESLIKQDYPKLRILVVDDHSTDDTSAILLRHKEKVEVIRNEINSGLAYGLNMALKMVKLEEYLFILEDDVELANSNYLSKAVDYLDHHQVAVVCGQAIGFDDPQMTLIKRFFARYTYLDHYQNGVHETSYTLIKADLMKLEAIIKVGGFGYAGNPKLGAEDQILAKRLHKQGYVLVKDSSLQYRLDFGRSKGLIGLYRWEANQGRTLGVAVSQNLINPTPATDSETRMKGANRRIQLAIIVIFPLSFLFLFPGWTYGVCIPLGILLVRYIMLLFHSGGFRFHEKLAFAGLGLANDFIFAFSFIYGYVCGLMERKSR